MVVHENIFEELINDVAIIASDGRQLIWCGENKWFMTIQKILKSVNINIEIVIDNSSAKKGVYTDEYKIVGFDKAVYYGNDANYIMCSQFGQEMEEQLKALGIRKENIYRLKPIEYIIESFERNFCFDMYKNDKMHHEELQKTLFDILCVFCDFCDREGLRYYLYDGTLLGAIRHKGFIPWDDDIDIAMPYEDFLKLKKIWNNDRYLLETWDLDENYEFSLPRIVDNHTKMIIPGNTIIGCYLDVFLLTGYPTEEEQIRQCFKDYKVAEEEWHSYYVLRKTKLKKDDCREKIFQRLYNMPFDVAEKVGVMRTEKQRAWTAPREWFAETVNIEFCNRFFKAPIGYDAYLSMKYGDYMSVPEPDKRERHGFIAYRDASNS